MGVASQSTIKMEKGYYRKAKTNRVQAKEVAIHNKNGKGLLPYLHSFLINANLMSQSTIKMEKGYYITITDYYLRITDGRNPQ